MDNKQFMPEDGMTIQFSLIMLHGKQKSGKTLIQEVYRGGCVDSGDIPNMPEVKDFIEKCKEGETITVDNFSYELCGEDYHTRDAAYEEIAEIIVDGFPFNYGGDILYNISHEGPEQFQIQNKEIYTEGGYQKMDEKGIEERFFDYLNEHVFPHIDYKELEKSYRTVGLDYAKSVLHVMHKAMETFYGTLFFSSTYRELNEGFILLPGVLEGANSGKICLALFPIDLHSSGELYTPMLLSKLGVHPMMGEGLGKEEKKYVKELFPFVYRYTAYVCGDYECESSGDPSIKMQSLLKTYSKHNDLLYLLDEKEVEPEDDLEQ